MSPTPPVNTADPRLLCFLVDNKRYEVPLILFKGYEHLPLISSQLQNLGPVTKRHPRHPTVLKDITVPAWDNLLTVLDARAFGKPTKELDEINWESVMEAATKFGFEDVQQQAITALERHLTPFAKINLGFKFKNQCWIYESYREICERDKSLTFDEAELLGLRRVTAISRIRDELNRHRLEELRRNMDSQAGRIIGSEIGSSMTVSGSTVCGEGENEVSIVEKLVADAIELQVSL